MSTAERRRLGKKHQSIQRRRGGKAAEDGQYLTKKTEAVRGGDQGYRGWLDISGTAQVQEEQKEVAFLSF